jgi:hypothetical protein
MTNPENRSSGDDAAKSWEANEADVIEQTIDDSDGENWTDAARAATAKNWDASEADVIEQAIEVPDDDAEFDR